MGRRQRGRRGPLGRGPSRRSAGGQLGLRLRRRRRAGPACGPPPACRMLWSRLSRRSRGMQPLGRNWTRRRHCRWVDSWLAGWQAGWVGGLGAAYHCVPISLPALQQLARSQPAAVSLSSKRAGPGPCCRPAEGAGAVPARPEAAVAGRQPAAGGRGSCRRVGGASGGRGPAFQVGEWCSRKPRAAGKELCCSHRGQPRASGRHMMQAQRGIVGPLCTCALEGVRAGKGESAACPALSSVGMAVVSCYPRGAAGAPPFCCGGVGLPPQGLLSSASRP